MYLKPSNIFYSQHQISATFGNWNRHRNTCIGETLDELYNDPRKINLIETINVVWKDGKWITIDNRRLWVFHHLEAAGKCKEIRVNKVEFCSVTHGRKFSSTNGGTSVKIIKNRSPGGIWYKRITPVTPTVENTEEQATQNEAKKQPVSTTVKTEEQVTQNVANKSITPNEVTEDKHAKLEKEYVTSDKDNVGKVTSSFTVYDTGKLRKVFKRINEDNSKPSSGLSVDSTQYGILATSFKTSSFYKRNSLIKNVAFTNYDKWTKGVEKSLFNKPIVSADIFKSKQLNRKWQLNIRYKPYKLMFSNANQPDEQFKKLHTSNIFRERGRFCFAEDNNEDEACDYMENDSLDYESEDISEDDEVSFVDERENAKNDDDDVYSYSGEIDESKEIDYDDDPWNDASSENTWYEPDFDELDVWESENDAHKAYMFPDSEHSDFEDDILISEEYEKMGRKKRIFLQREKEKLKQSSNKPCITTKDSKMLLSDNILRTRSSSSAKAVAFPGSEIHMIPENSDDDTSTLVSIYKKTSTIVMSDIQIERGFLATDFGTNGEKCPVIHANVNDTTFSKCADYSLGVRETIYDGISMDATVSTRCENINQSDLSKSVDGSTNPISFNGALIASPVSETCMTKMTNSASSLKSSASIIPEASSRANVNAVESLKSSLSDSTGSDSDSDESSIETDYSSEDDEKYERRCRIREIAIKKYGYDLFGSDHD